MSAIERTLESGNAETGVLQCLEGSDQLRKRNLAVPMNQAKSVSLDSERGQARGYNFIGKDAPGLTNQFRSVKQMVLEQVSAQRKEGLAPIIAVTSAVSGEGKSFTSTNLALSLALERGITVTLIDFDTIRPASTLLFGAEKLEGLQDYLNNSASLDSVVRETNFSNLRFLSAGLEVENSVELLTSTAVDDLLSVFRKRGPQQIFLFDCPPLLASEATRYLAKIIDFTVLVVRAEQTSQHWTMEAVERLGENVKFGFLLNGRVGTQIDQYYGYYKLEQ
jgi:capsular exopolysaccharide synthesis family protein